MIIEAGYDIVELLINGVANRRKKDTEDVDENPLWVLTMDSQLRYWSTTRVVDRMGSSSAEHVDDIARTLNEEPRYSRYYVLAHAERADKRDDDDWLYDLDQIIKHHPALEGHELLGHVVFDDTGAFSTVPRYSFRDYVGLEHLPRAASFPGPHEWLDCPCAACVQHEKLLKEIRTRHRNSTSDADS
ncbi:hypothetical protein SAMN06295879_2645 [Agreia bicolorata]|uniref:Uncharacterized protein n=1 Tax=Agreia bicolorata TaxID=110935 RepID=A0A1T4YB37_9MICO|nr:hypothetical protein [Agreia bicolorata]SKA98989.1 hypothetical protein SAMN06295879_2645 [Agreia bicolorata]